MKLKYFIRLPKSGPNFIFADIFRGVKGTVVKGDEMEGKRKEDTGNAGGDSDKWPSVGNISDSPMSFIPSTISISLSFFPLHLSLYSYQPQ